jgi:hypothetical protein
VEPTLHIAILVATAAAAFTIIGYEDHARAHGWTVGKWLAGAAPPLKVAAFLIMPFALWKAWYLHGWWAVVGVAIGAFLVSFLASMTLRANIQIAAIVLMVIGGIATLLLGATIGP